MEPAITMDIIVYIQGISFIPPSIPWIMSDISS